MADARRWNGRFRRRLPTFPRPSHSREKSLSSYEPSRYESGICGGSTCRVGMQRVASSLRADIVSYRPNLLPRGPHDHGSFGSSYRLDRRLAVRRGLPVLPATETNLGAPSAASRRAPPAASDPLRSRSGARRRSGSLDSPRTLRFGLPARSPGASGREKFGAGSRTEGIEAFTELPLPPAAPRTARWRPRSPPRGRTAGRPQPRSAGPPRRPPRS